MRNPLIPAMLVVFGFWLAMLYVLLPWPAQYGFFYLKTLLVALSAAGAAFLVLLCVGWFMRWVRQGEHERTRVRGVVCSIGRLPGRTRWARGGRGRIDARRWPLTAIWYSSAPEDYQRAFRAVMQVLAGAPNHPASPVQGGHGDATLLEHTLNVVETGLELMDTWIFERRPRDPLHGASLSPDDVHLAVLILAGHDIGKLDAFRVKDGKVEEWKRSHDREGARILATIDEIWELPEDDRKALIAVVAHEHHPQDLPTHTGEDVRLLMEFLIDIDTVASRSEEGRQVGAEDGASAQVGAQDAQDAQDREEDEALFDWFVDLLSKPNTVNGRDKRFRAAFKGQDQCLYFNESDVRKMMASQFYRDPHQAEARRGDGRYIITMHLLRVLDDKGLLVTEWNGQRFNGQNALFRVISEGRNGAKVNEWSAAFVVRLGDWAPANVLALAPAPNPPRIKGAVYPQRALKTRAVTADAGEEEASSDTTPSSEETETPPVRDEEGGEGATEQTGAPDEAHETSAAPAPVRTDAETEAASDSSEDEREPQPPLPTPSPFTLPPEFGLLGRCILAGIEKTEAWNAFDVNGHLDLDLVRAGYLARENGLPSCPDTDGGIVIFFETVSKTPEVIAGLEIVRDSAGEICRIRSQTPLRAPVESVAPVIPEAPLTPALAEERSEREVDMSLTGAADSLSTDAAPTSLESVCWEDATQSVSASTAAIDSFEFGSEDLDKINQSKEQGKQKRYKHNHQRSSRAVFEKRLNNA